MSNPTLESTIHEILDLKRMREELDAEITALEDSIKAAMGEEEILTAGAYKVSCDFVKLTYSIRHVVFKIQKICLS